MACPYFYPVARLDKELWAIPPRLPLGDAYQGECRALETPRTPEDTALRGVCNSGYARGACPQFPEDARSDAVRFSVASDSGDRIRIQFVFEKACWPVEHGELLYAPATHAFAPSPLDEITNRQAEVFMESYLRRAR